MNKAAFYITAAALVVGGAIVSAVGYTVSAKEEKTTYTKTFDAAASLDLDISNCRLTIVTDKNAKDITLEVKDMVGGFEARTEGNTFIAGNKTKSRFRLVNFGFLTNEGSITLTIPEKEYNSVKLDLNAIKKGEISDITVNDLSMDLSAVEVVFSDINVMRSTGEMDMNACEVELFNCSFPAMSLESDAYDLDMRGCEFNGKLKFDGSAGDLEAVNCTFADMDIDNSAGKIALSNIYLKGDADIDSSAGSVELSIIGDKDNYSVKGNTSAGSMTVDGNSGSYVNSGAEYTITVDNSAGDVRINFVEPME